MALSKTKTDEVALLKKKVEMLEKQVEAEREAAREPIEPKKPKELRSKNKYIPNKVLYDWKAPLRVYVSRTRTWFLQVTLVAVLLIILLLFFDKPLLVAAILAYVFFAFASAAFPPPKVKHEITKKGILTLGTLYKWKELNEFWFVKRNDQYMLFVSCERRFVPVLTMLVGSGSVEKISGILQKHMPYKYKESQNKLEKLIDGDYIFPKDLPGRIPYTNKGEV